MIIFWDHPDFIPPRGYFLTVFSLGIMATVNSTSFMVSRATAGTHKIEIQPLSRHFPGVTVTHMAKIRGESKPEKNLPKAMCIDHYSHLEV